MFRKILMLIVTLGLFLTLLSCSYGIQGDNNLKYVKVDDCEQSVLSYNGDLYYPTETPYLELWTTPEDIELGSQSSLFFGKSVFYTYESARPLYIWIIDYSGNHSLAVYVRKDFLYREQKYLLAGTDVEVKFFEEIERPGYDVPSDDWISSNDRMILYLGVDDRVTEDKNRLAIDHRIIFANDGNYYIFSDGPWLLSDDLVRILKENGVIRN